MSGTGPAQVVVVTGTGTSVGKTVVTAAVAALASAAGRRVAVVKPAQTGVAAGEPGDLSTSAGSPGSARTTCTSWRDTRYRWLRPPRPACRACRRWTWTPAPGS